MRLTVTHKTSYHYGAPVSYALQQLRLMPKDSTGQTVINWQTHIEGGRKQVSYTDQHRNHVDLISFDEGADAITVTSTGEVEITLKSGIVGKHIGLAPLWLFKRQTALTKPGPNLRKLADHWGKQEKDAISCLHGLSAAIHETVSYEIGQTDAETTAETALTEGAGVCQDHAHIFISAARHMGFPARYVSGYLMMNDRIDQDASHAWVEVHVSDIGWVGFDVSNGIAPDERYIRVATGLDYHEAAPVSGMRFGEAEENMIVSLQVQQ